MIDISYSGSCLDILRAVAAGVSRADYSKHSGFSMRTIENRLQGERRRYEATTLPALIYKLAKKGVI